MRAIVLRRHGGPESLALEERREPHPGPGEVRIAVAAAGVNFADVLARVGLYPDAPRPPCVLGYEVAGAVDAVGEGVGDAELGRRVIANTPFGGYAEKVVVPAPAPLALPDALSFAQGAAIPVNYSTAWAALVRYGNVQPGERVLIHSAGGGVGTAATQLAVHLGAEVHGTASPGKHARIVANGVEHPIDYTRRGWERELPRFDLVMDPLGGRSWRTSYRLLRPGGRLVAFGMSSLLRGGRRRLWTIAGALLAAPRIGPLRQMSTSTSVIGLNMYALWRDRGTLGPWMESLQPLLQSGVVRPVLAAELPFEAVGEAHGMLSDRRNLGKVVLVNDAG